MTRDVDPLAATDAPADRSVVELDVSDLPPPQPLQETVQQAADLGDEAVLVQYNDRAPQLLFPKLEDRGLSYDVLETGDSVLTTIWRDS